MGIKLDWELESEGGWEEVDEDPASIIARQKERQRRMAMITGALALLIAIVGGGVYQLRRLAAERQAQLEAAIATETTALRIGDREAFLDVQADINMWQIDQIAVFERYQDEIIATGQILELEIDLDRARVVLHEEIGEDSYHVTWFYRRTDDGWRHVPPDLGQWSEQVSASTRHFDITYREVDQPLVDALAPLLDDWWHEAQTATGFTGSVPRPEVIVSSSPIVHWQTADGWTLAIPSTYIQRISADGSLNPALVGAVADAIMRRWAEVVMDSGRPDPTGDLQWFEEELALWLRYELNPEYPTFSAHTTQYYPPTPAPFLNPLTAAYGSEILPDLITFIRSADHIVEPLQVATGELVANLPVDWSSFVESRLLAEGAMLSEGGVSEVDRVFRDTSGTRRNQGLIRDVPTELAAINGSMRVRNTQWIGDILLAEVEIEVTNYAFGEPGRYITYEPFSIIESRWLHTRLIPRDWGEAQIEESERFVLVYYELDTPFVEGLLTSLEEAYDQMVTDYGIEAGTEDKIVVAVSPTQAELPLIRTSLSDSNVRLITESPYVGKHPADVDPSLMVKADLYYQLAEMLVDQKSGTIAMDHPLPRAFVRWGVGRVDADAAAVYPPPEVPVAAGPNDLRALWPDRLVRQASIRRTYYTEYTIGQLLVDKILLLKGPEVAPVLIGTLPTAESLDQWLAPLGLVVDDLYLP